MNRTNESIKRNAFVNHTRRIKMSSATAAALPEAVIAAAQKSRDLQQGMIDGKVVPSEEIAPAVIEEETVPPVTQDDKVVDKKKKPGRPKKVVAKPDDKVVTPEVVKAPEDNKENDLEYWKQKFKAVENMNKSTISDLKHRNAALEENKALTNQLLANYEKAESNVVAVAEKITKAPDIPEIVIPEDDIKIYGDEQVDFTRRVVQSEIAPLLNPILNRLAVLEEVTNSIDALTNQINGVMTTQNNQVAQTYEEKLGTICPDWNNYASDGGVYFDLFWNWAGNTSPKFSDKTFDVKIREAHKQGNASIVADIIDEFKKLAGHVAPNTVAESTEVPVATEVVQDTITPSLEEQVVPVDAGGDTLPNIKESETEILNDSDVRQFYTDLAAGKFTEDKELKMKRTIADALREGRINPNT